MQKTVKHLRAHYYIKNLDKKVRDYIKTCRACSARKDIPFNEKKHTWADNIITNLEPMKLLYMDIKYLPKTKSGNRYLLVMKDAHTRYAITHALRNKTAISVAEALMTTFMIYEPCKYIVCDQGTEFKNLLVQTLLESFNIKVHFCSVANHSSNSSERQIGILSDIMIHYLKKHDTNWDMYHDVVCHVYNTQILNHYGISPFELMFGRPPPDPYGLNQKILQMTKTPVYDIKTYLQLAIKRQEEIFKIMTDKHNQQIKDRNAKRTMKVHKSTDLLPGEVIYVLCPAKSALTPLDTKHLKMHLKYVGPLIVQQKSGINKYQIRTIKGEILSDNYHLHRLKRGTLRCPHGKVISNIQECQEHGNTDTKCPNQDNSVNYICDLKLTDLNPGTGIRTDEKMLDDLDSEGVQIPFTGKVQKARYQQNSLQILTDVEIQSTPIWIKVPKQYEEYYAMQTLQAGLRIVGTPYKFK